MMEMTFRNNFDLRKNGELWVKIIFDEIIHSLPHGWWVFMHKKRLCCYFDTKISISSELVGTVRNHYNLRNMGGKRKSIEPKSCKEWKQKNKIQDIL